MVRPLVEDVEVNTGFALHTGNDGREDFPVVTPGVDVVDDAADCRYHTNPYLTPLRELE